MKPQINEKYLITTDGWFIAPDGNQYKSVFGTVTGIENDEATLGIKTNRSSTNWYITIGNMIVAGCQIHYCIKTDSVSAIPDKRAIVYNGKLNFEREDNSRIYCADANYQG